jgi:hypothetical protein
VETYSQAQDAVEILIDFFENSDTSGGVFDALSVIEGNLRALGIEIIQTEHNSKMSRHV